jgi:hypothetical protein
MAGIQQREIERIAGTKGQLRRLLNTLAKAGAYEPPSDFPRTLTAQHSVSGLGRVSRMILIDMYALREFEAKLKGIENGQV